MNGLNQVSVSSPIINDLECIQVIHLKPTQIPFTIKATYLGLFELTNLIFTSKWALKV